ncbi:hypothetical protein NMQ03_08800 [Arthrobacter sp. DNA4]|uniref:hypothetical protein n=1 Tax=Arthrobacter sp. DNA4 TaxID=2963432 RepID=UPI0020CE9C07|nr:hypothetical protein [Arthrobacter sp. DNA4]UTT71156.1 hypothetical protein NMQ03_08800 [Arthrobacter sp. DNA4]
MAERNASEWNELAAEGRRIPWGVARNGDLIEYGKVNADLSEATGLPAFDLSTDRGRADISRLLVMIHDLDWEEGNKHMLTSSVKLKSDNNPGKGSFTLARERGLYDPAMPELAFWSRQVELAHQAHKRVRPAPR